MQKSELRGYKIEKLEFINMADGVRQIELTHKYSYSVGYSDKTCKGEFAAVISDKNAPDEFKINITVSGLFSIAPDAQKEFLHLETYDMLFPYVRVLVSTLTASAGNSPLFIPYIDISDKNIYRVELPHPPENGR